MPKPPPPSLSLVVRRLREQAGWSQQELAERSGLSASYPNLVENGKGGKRVARQHAYTLGEIMGFSGAGRFRVPDSAGQLPGPSDGG
jgi:transcriptional regulator with XRE-family HTH domain